MPDVRAKFRVESVTQYRCGGEVELAAVTGGSEENKSFWHYTPGGTIKMHIDNQEAMDRFKPGQEFYVDFTSAE